MIRHLQLTGIVVMLLVMVLSASLVKESATAQGDIVMIVYEVDCA